MLQEQHWTSRTKSPIHHAWTTIEPTTSDDDIRPRSVIYINNNILSASQIAPLPLPFNDITAVRLFTEDAKPHLIMNIYNPNDNDLTEELHEYLRNNINIHDYDIIIIGGDFNLHHPIWNPEGYTYHDKEADALVEMMTELELSLLLPPGTITYPNDGTIIDLIWGSNEATNRVITCRIAEEHDHGSDHLPIETTISIQTKQPQSIPSYNYAKTNWKELNNKLESYLLDLTPIHEGKTTETEIDKYAEQLVNAINRAVEETTPRK